MMLTLCKVMLLFVCGCKVYGEECKQLIDECPCMNGTLNCSSHQLTELPAFAIYTDITGIQALVISNNNIDRLGKNAFKGLSVTKIDVSSNPLVEISDNAFSDVQMVTELRMNNCTLGLVHAAVSQLVSLEKLFLENNSISTLPSSVFHSLPKLKELHLAGNAIQFVSPFDAFNNLKMLELLDLSRNEMHSISIEVLHSLTALKILKLEDNHIRTLPENIFQNNTELTEINLMKNELIFADGVVLVNQKNVMAHDVTVFKDLHNLEILLLSHCKITNLDQEMFKNKPHLRNLGLSHSQFVGIKEGAFNDVIQRLEALDASGSTSLWPSLKPVLQNGQNLKQLKLSSLNLIDIPTDVFKHMDQLMFLTLDNNKVQKLKAGAFNGVKGLNAKIHLENNLISDVSPYVFRGMSPPLSMYLNNNRLTSVDFINDNPCSFDRSLIDVSGNEIKCDCTTAEVTQKKMVDLIGTCNATVSDQYSGLSLSPLIGGALEGGKYLEEKAVLVCKSLESHTDQKYDCCNSKWVSIGTPATCQVLNAGQRSVPYNMYLNTFVMIFITIFFNLHH